MTKACKQREEAYRQACKQRESVCCITTVADRHAHHLSLLHVDGQCSQATAPRAEYDARGTALDEHLGSA